MKRCCLIQYSRGNVVKENIFKTHPNFKGEFWNNSCDTGKACIELWNKIQTVLWVQLFYIPCVWSTHSKDKLENVWGLSQTFWLDSCRQAGASLQLGYRGVPSLLHSLWSGLCPFFGFFVLDFEMYQIVSNRLYI